MDPIRDAHTATQDHCAGAENPPVGVTLLALFFLFGATMSALTVFLLLVPGTPLDTLWRLNQSALVGFRAIGFWAVLLMLAICAGCFSAAAGLWRMRRFGYWIALSLLTLNICGDLANAVISRDSRVLIGPPIALLMIIYLARVRRAMA